MRFQVGGVDHEAFGLGSVTGKCCEDAEAASANETVTERLVRSLVLGRTLPLQGMLDDGDKAADDTANIDTGNAV